MKKFRSTRRRHPRNAPGSAPGTIAVSPDAEKPAMHVIAYGPGDLVERDLARPEEVTALRSGHNVTWLNVDGLGDGHTIEEIGRLFDLHPLALEDVVNVSQRPKVEEYDRTLFVVVRMPATETNHSEQISVFLGAGFVVTFQERPGDCLDAVRDRLRRERPRIRSSGSDYLAYAILDAVIDAYFPVLESHGDRLERLETDIAENPSQKLLNELHTMKGELIALRRVAWATRDMTGSLVRDETDLITEDTRLFLRDCHDHATQLIDFVETYRDATASLVDLYLSSISNRMNEVMKVLTIIATVFIPLGFVAGVYGMNFDAGVSRWNMPELGWRFGYPYAIGLMLLVVIVMLVYFRRKKWL